MRSHTHRECYVDDSAKVNINNIFTYKMGEIVEFYHKHDGEAHAWVRAQVVEVIELKTDKLIKSENGMNKEALEDSHKAYNLNIVSDAEDAENLFIENRIENVHPTLMCKSFQLHDAVRAYKMTTQTWEDGFVSKIVRGLGGTLYHVQLLPLREIGRCPSIVADKPSLISMKIELNDQLLAINGTEISVYEIEKAIKILSSLPESSDVSLRLARTGQKSNFDVVVRNLGFGFATDENTGAFVHFIVRIG